MASSSSRKSNSSASNQKPTFRRSTGAKRAAAPAPRVASASAPSRAAAPSASRVRTYTAPTKKAASLRASSAKSAKSTSRAAKRTTASTATRAVGKPRVTPTARKASSVSTKQVAKQVRSQAPAAKPTRSAQKPAAPNLSSIGRAKASTPSRKAASGAFRFALPTRSRSDAQAPKTTPHPQAPSRIRATASLRERIQAFGIVRLILISVISVAVLVGILAVVVVNSSLFAVVDVVVEGSDHIPQQTAEQLVDLPEGATLLNVDEDQIASRLLENPWVESVSIEREFPHTITVKPVERDVAAIAYIVADDVAWAIGDDDAWIAPLSVAVQQDSAADDEADGTDGDGTSDEDPLDEESTDGEDGGTDEDGDGEEGDAQDAATSSGLEAAYQVALDNDAVLLTDVNADVSPSAGKPVDDEVIRAGLEYIHGFTSEFLAMIKDLSLPSVEAISANLTSGVEVSLGEPEDIQQKEQVIRRLIEQESGVTYINVRVADAYSFRSADIS
ncbi:FtsQ-type POTRA domain-containing protein [Collinsella tanakaei]|uniref:FtsQ-type POTRA domain-containing protein n=1 Tax=Collinsella tanakaei TaxID=626935 RepID=UPI0025A4279E|nr:FtsQ-type POTRA domain-containing protein [Collinsella tanakaei]MDM8302147.1 FtsQ-type POTRA domain-containing protein [Collinsella tanakaei]